VPAAGFHPTSVFGAIAAAAAVAATLGSTERQTVNALGITGSMAGGLIEYLAEGAWTKRLHPGWAAQAGLHATLFAHHGFVVPRTVLEGPHGLFNGFARARDGDYRQLTEGFGEEWIGAALAFKPYACGTTIHPYIDCAVRLARRGVTAEAIAEIVCEAAGETIERLWEPLSSKQAPPTPYAAKFSPPFCMAAGFVLGHAGLAAFTEETVRDPRLKGFAAKVRYAIAPDNPDPAGYAGHLSAKLIDGRVIEERQPHLRGGTHEPLSRAAIEEKFFTNAAFGGWPRHRAQAALDRLRHLFSGPVDLAPLRG
jgi:2-methylcitrate dehydratase PrpD